MTTEEIIEAKRLKSSDEVLCWIAAYCLTYKMIADSEWRAMEADAAVEELRKRL